MKNRIRTIALVIFSSILSCKSLSSPNGPNLITDKVPDTNIKLDENFTSEKTPNQVLSSLNSVDQDTENQSKYNFIDSSKTAMEKLRSLINSGKYSELFGTNIDEIHSRIFLNSDQVAIEGTVSQQGHSRILNSRQKDSADDPFYYSSNPNQHTSQNCYIVKMKPSVEKSVFEKLSDVFGIIDAKIYKTYRHGFLGYSICFPENTLPLLLMKEISAIEFVERDNVIKATQIQEDAPWGLARLSSPDPKSSYFGFDGTGQGVTVYVIDSGLSEIKGINCFYKLFYLIFILELGDRGILGFTAFPNDPVDCAGHGTEVASLIAGTNVGVAKQANVVMAQVLDCLGDGKNSDLLDAISWIIETHQKPAVINMSLGGDRSPSVDNAVRAAVAAGIPVVVAAGNSNLDACTQSPAAVVQAITVAASTLKNNRAKFSNFGPCVDIFAPGVDILAATSPQKSRNGWNFASGTSFAAPLVAGVVALLLEKNPGWSPIQIDEAIKSLGAKAVLSKKTMNGSPNILIQAPSSSSKIPILVKLAAPSYLPMLGFHTSSIVTIELILLICSFIAAIIALFATGIALYRRHQKRASSNNVSISEEELKHSILNSHRPSVFL